MKPTPTALLGLFALFTPAYAVLTKGYIQIKGANWEKGVNLSTLFDDYDGDVIASDAATPLKVQLDLERAQTTDSNVEILNGFWTDLYPYLGVSARSDYDVNPTSPYIGFVNVQETPDAHLQRKENSFTACYPNPMAGLPYQASAIWRYDPSAGGKLTPTVLGLDGSRLPYAIQGGWWEDNFHFSVGASSRPGEQLGFFFVPTTE
ncbi:hypothetical protein FA13DRAFT_1795887 [Coprinellus micaceus]|uniref:Uncharacterized protein n=1 Tax=Coprinellus micaceus TaxID=71717 RepID=A0A4Y7SWN0_COPMI|nr:hypothetical protein FA13DRAFT_1795887 [Coprinellus micaceus]